MSERTYTLEQIQQANVAAGLHWFDADAIRFFSSRLSSTVHVRPNGRVFFVSSEMFDYSSPRLYTVREFMPQTGAVETVGEFQQFAKSYAAHNAIRRGEFDAWGSDAGA